MKPVPFPFSGRRSSIGALAFFLLASLSHAQWVPQASGTTDVLRGVFFADSSFGWAVGSGNGGFVWKTTNGGNTWTSSKANDDLLNAVQFLNRDTGYAVGSYGLAVKTTNGGSTWQSGGVVNNNVALRSVYFLDASNGYAVGGGAAANVNIMIKTVNGGASWNMVSVPPCGILRSVRFVNRRVGWATSDSGRIIKSIDSGNTWTQQPPLATQPLTAIFFLDSSTGWIAGNNGVVLKTVNGGTTWTSLPTGTSANLSALFFLNGNLGWAVGASGTILKTTDGGGSWVSRKTGSNDLNAISFAGGGNGWAVGSSGAILKYRPITVTSPKGGEVWVPGNSYNITWSSDTASNVKLEYSTNGGDSWSVLASSTLSTGIYAWSVPNTPSTQAKIRISDANHGEVATVSDSVFTISPPSLSLTSPNGGENWTVGAQHSITWLSGGVATVKLEYSANNGSSWTTIAASTNGALGAYAWTVPNAISNQVKVRISDTANVATADTSNGVFTISAPPASIVVTSPNGGETWQDSSVHNITWNSVSVVNVKLEYSLNNGAAWYTIVASTSALGGYSWTVPNTPSTQALIRASDASNAAVSDISNGVFNVSNVASVRDAGKSASKFFSDGSRFHFNLSSRAHVVLKAYDVRGDKTFIFLNQDLEAGDHAIPVPKEIFSSLSLVDFRAGDSHATLLLPPR